MSCKPFRSPMCQYKTSLASFFHLLNQYFYTNSIAEQSKSILQFRCRLEFEVDFPLIEKLQWFLICVNSYVIKQIAAKYCESHSLILSLMVTVAHFLPRPFGSWYSFSFIHISFILFASFCSEVPALYNALDQSQDCTQFSQYLASQVQVTWVGNLNSLELCFILKNDLKKWMKQERKLNRVRSFHVFVTVN